MVSIIKLYYEEQFTLPAGDKVQFFETRSLHKKKACVQHPPFLPFDTLSKGGWEAWLYHQKFQLIGANRLSLLRKFIQKATHHAKLRADEALWYDTGFWTIRKATKAFIGIGLNSLKNAIKELKNGDLYFCLANRDSIVGVSSTFESGAVLQGTSIHTYVTNASLPFVTVVQPYRNAIDDIGKNTILEEGTMLEPAIHRRLRGKGKLVLNPVATVETTSGTVFVVVENPFDLKDKMEFCPLKHLMAYTSGGFLKSDFNKRKFYFWIESWILDDELTISEFWVGRF